MLLPFCAVCLWIIFSRNWECSFFQIPVLALFSEELFSSLKFAQVTTTDPTNELAMIGLLLSLCFIALSKEKDEDEMTGQIRMQSFVWSLWLTAAIMLFGIVFIYGMSFVEFSFAAIYIVFFAYILKFNIAMAKIRRVGR